MIIIESRSDVEVLYHSLSLCMFESFHNEVLKGLFLDLYKAAGGFLWSV